MSTRDHWLFFWSCALIGVLVLATVVGAFIVMSFVQGSKGAPLPNLVAAVSTWQGGDETTYYNLTIAYQGGVVSYVVTCDYYPVNSTDFPIMAYPKELMLGPYMDVGVGPGGAGLPVGCGPS